MNKLLLITAVLLTSGCAVNKDWAPYGGSKADGVAKIAYTYTYMEKPMLLPAQGDKMALKICSKWGYRQAEAFGFTSRRCVAYSTGGCDRWLVEQEYQCI